MATFRTLVTTAGLALIADSQVNDTPINLTAMAVGDGNGNPVVVTEGQTALVRERFRATLNSLAVDPSNSDRYIAELVIPAVIGGFVIREAGLFTADGVLFAVANVPDAYKPVDTEGAFSDTVVRMIVDIGNAANVTLMVDPNVIVATRSWVLNNVSGGLIFPGGLTNQILTKASNADGDTEWRDPGAGVEVIVYSREETQTLAAAQTAVTLAVLSTLGIAVYIEGVRLRDDEFTVNTSTQLTLASSYPAGTKITVVQNEEVGVTDLLLRPNNLSDVPDKAAARTNLELPTWLAASNIGWSQLTGVPAFASRWPTFAEVTGKPSTYPPSAHGHAIGDVTGLQAALDGKQPNLGFTPLNKAGDTATGQLKAPATAGFTPTANTLTGAAWTATGAYGGGYMLNNGAQWCGVWMHTDGSLRLGVGGATGLAARMAMTAESTTFAGTVISEGAGNGYAFRARDVPTQYWTLYANAGAARLFLDGSGDRFAVTNGGEAQAVGGFRNTSSRRVKDIEGPNPYGLDEVLKLETVVGAYKPEFIEGAARRVFLVAENVAEHIDGPVRPMDGIEFEGEPVLGLDYQQLVPVLVRAIQELTAEVRALKVGA